VRGPLWEINYDRSRYEDRAIQLEEGGGGEKAVCFTAAKKKGGRLQCGEKKRRRPLNSGERASCPIDNGKSFGFPRKRRKKKTDKTEKRREGKD